MKKILLLQDTTSVFSAQLAAQLEAEGFCVDQLHEEQSQWLDKVAPLNPDVILMEVSPDSYRARYQFCHQLRQNPTTENLPILLLGAANGDKSDTVQTYFLLEGLHAGANDYVQAPYEIAELVGKLNAALRLKNSLEKAQVLAEQLNSVNDELYKRNIQVEKELYIARQLQQSLLPKPISMPDEESDLGPLYTKVHYEDEKLRVSGIYLPCDALGGDLYDVLKLPDNILGVSITDVSGHGVPAGFITAIFKTSLYRIAHQMRDPAQILFHLNNELYDIVKTGDYVTSCYLSIDMNTMQMECSGAGHPYPVYYNAQTKAIRRIQENGTPLVWVRDIEYPKATLQLKPGDKVFMFTDGISELRNPLKEMFGEERIEQILIEAIETEHPFFTDLLIGYLSDYTEGYPLEDDISMVLVEVL